MFIITETTFCGGGDCKAIAKEWRVGLGELVLEALYCGGRPPQIEMEWAMMVIVQGGQLCGRGVLHSLVLTPHLGASFS